MANKKLKEVTTTIEDTVTFMVNPTVEYVSLVKHGANRAPFKVMKSEKLKEVLGMANKVVQSVLIRNDVSEENISKLEGIDKRSKKAYTTFTAYPQIHPSKIDPKSAVVVKHEAVEGILFVLGDLAEGESESGTLMMDAKAAVDYATMDNLYTELYAMADVVGGAMRQENAEASFRKTTILTAIDNFKTFAEIVLETLDDGKVALGVKAEDHPTLVVDLTVKEETADEKAAREKAEKEAADKKVADDAAAAAAASSGDDDDTGKNKDKVDFDGFVDKFNETLTNFGNSLVASIKEVGQDVKDSNKSMKDSVEVITKGMEDIHNTTLSMKSEGDDDDTSEADEKEEKLFSGVLFRKQA